MNKWIVNNYFDYLESNFPAYKQSLTGEYIQSLEELFFSVNDVFVTCNLFEKEIFQELNFINLIREFKTYFSRILLLIPLNDRYILDALFRLLIEKLYRMIYGLNHIHLNESSIRKHERWKMGERLEGKLSKKDDLDLLYKEYSNLIHHSSPTQTDLLNFRQLADYETELLTYANGIVNNLKLIYIIDFLIPLLNEKPLDLASRLTLSNELQQTCKSHLEEVNII
ncbi:hypothetical protein [Brevibacillus reuszeri]|uniref:hypothetical protein n=1 Tax=Brevibacillus reuszeri TaxID=54915 RepID=UPI003D1B91E5